jgi:drug/metabolite transporter (DMT)-like permease
LIFSACVLGISFAALFVRWALPAPPVITGFYRMLFAGLIVGVWLVATRRPVVWRGRAAFYAACSGACFGTDLALWHTSIVHTSVALSTLLVNTTPIYVGLYATLVLRESLDRRFTTGAGLALLGTVVLLGVPEEGAGQLAGAALALFAAVFYAGYLLLMRAARQGGVDAVSALFVMTACAAAALAGYGWLGGDAFAGFPTSSWLAMLGAATVTQIGGVMGIIWTLRFLPATIASVALLAQPVGTAILGWLLLGEAIGPVQVVGGATVLAGIVLASRSAALSRSPAPS